MIEACARSMATNMHLLLVANTGNRQKALKATDSTDRSMSAINHGVVYVTVFVLQRQAWLSGKHLLYLACRLVL
jgi:hypothetical protein